MRSIHDTPLVFIGDIDLGNSTILRVDILPSDRRVRYSILRRAGTKLAVLDGFAIDVSTFRSFRCSRSMRTQEPELNAMSCKYQARNRF
jgi:hypothetical protein